VAIDPSVDYEEMEEKTRKQFLLAMMQHNVVFNPFYTAIYFGQ
jgi:hypothetical protein